jgi:hypothetical protein
MAARKPFTKSTPIPLSSLISNPSVKSKGVYAYHLSARLKKLWELAVGGKVKEFSYPYRLRDGVLYVAVTDSIWFSEIKLISKEILEKVNAADGEITDIRFKLTDEKVTASASRIERIKENAVLSEDETRLIGETAERIKDQELREIFRNSMSASYKLSKGSK